jgi:hypothetical protein
MNMSIKIIHPCDKALALLEEEGFEVLDKNERLIRCPGESYHSTANSLYDCKVLNGRDGPYLKCFHRSCEPLIDGVNHWLSGNHSAKGYPNRTAQCGGSQYPLRSTGPVQARIRQVIADNPWTYHDIVNSSPAKVADLPVEDHFRAQLMLFDDQDIVWIGRDLQDSGSPSHVWRFRAAEKWQSWDRCPGAFICPNTFKRGVDSRSGANVSERRFLVVESDLLNHDQVGSVFQWMIAEGYNLRAVVDTAGKSLHGWFDYPPRDKIPALQVDLTELGCDPSMFTPSQPCRLPGALRDGTQKYQKLIYLDLNNQNL